MGKKRQLKKKSAPAFTLKYFAYLFKVIFTPFHACNVLKKGIPSIGKLYINIQYIHIAKVQYSWRCLSSPGSRSSLLTLKLQFSPKDELNSLQSCIMTLCS